MRIIFGASVILLALCSLVKAADFELVEFGGKPALLMSGAIDSGTANKFMEFLDEVTPREHSLPILLLNSPGGDVVEALAMSAMMDAYPFHTIIPNGASCASACASIVFIAGTNRTIEPEGRFGQHSCARGGQADEKCNALISTHAFNNGVSYGSVAAFINYTPPEQVVWMRRMDLDGWGISRYPGEDTVNFGKSEPVPLSFLMNREIPPTNLWRLEMMEDGWKAFVRPVRDDEPEFQINLFCAESMPGNLIVGLNITGDAVQVRDAIISANFSSTSYSEKGLTPVVTSDTGGLSMVSFIIPKEHVKDFLTKSEGLRIDLQLKPGFEPIYVSAPLTDSRKNLIFAANNCLKV